MKLRALELEQFRKFDRPVRVSGLSDGLNVLCGPNEFGKSTLLAAVRGLLFERYSSKAEPVRRMQPLRGNAAPRLAMEFDLGDGCWRIEKRFLHQPLARLTAPDGARFEADAAEEELQRLLGFGAASKKGATSDQHGVWGALWVTQRQSVEQANLTSDLARSAVSSCLDAEVGVLTGSEKGQSIRRAAQQQLAALVDGNVKPRGRYKEVVGALAEKAGQLTELRDREQRLAKDSDDLRSARVRLVKLEEPDAVRQDEVGLSEARRLREAAQLFDQKWAAVAAQHDLAAREVSDAARERDARQARRGAIAEKRQDADQAAETVRQVREASKAADATLACCRTAEAAAQERATAAADALRDRRAVLDLAQLASGLAGFRSVLAEAAEAQERAAGLAAKLSALRVDKDAIAQIRQAVRDRDVAQSVLQAQATAIDFDIEAAGKVSLDGAEVAPGQKTVSVVLPTEVAVAGVGRIVVRPAIRDLRKLRARAVETAARLHERLTACGCADPDEAERHFLERDVVESALREARADLQRLTPGEPSSGLTAGVEALRERVKGLEVQVESRRKDLNLAELPDTEAATIAVDAADDEDRLARAALTQARAELDTVVMANGAAHAALLRAEGLAAAALAEVERLTAEDAAAIVLETDAALGQLLAAAECRRADHSDALARLDRERSPDTVAAMNARIQRYEQALKNRTDAIRKLREEIAALRARITQEGGAGLEEVIAATEREHQALQQERDGSDREVQVLRLLIDTLGDAERETKARYLAPVVRRVTPYLTRLFPGAEIACDDALRITGLARDGRELQDFELLSDGTQEQVAVLARLAFAELLIDQGRPAMVILDDALAFSDDERIERMFDVLTDAAARIQILVLSCREDMFARLGGHRLELLSLMEAV